MKKLGFILFFFLLMGNINAQASKEFKDAAFRATSRYNNVNKKCDKYADKLLAFLRTNASKYDVDSYKAYKVTAKNGNQYIVHDDYSKNKAISINGTHVFVVIEGEVFDNHHPRGADMADWSSKLVCPSGSYPSGFDTEDY